VPRAARHARSARHAVGGILTPPARSRTARSRQAHFLLDEIALAREALRAGQRPASALLASVFPDDEALQRAAAYFEQARDAYERKQLGGGDGQQPDTPGQAGLFGEPSVRPGIMVETGDNE
jgi:hypothetical protein